MGTQALQIHIVETLAHLLSYIAYSYDQWNLFKNLSKSDLSTFFCLFLANLAKKKLLNLYLLNFLTCFQMLYKNVIWLK